MFSSELLILILIFLDLDNVTNISEFRTHKYEVLNLNFDKCILTLQYIYCQLS
jgi:hypothetical protein